MADFMIRFLLCNVFISIIIGILFAVKRLLKNKLTSRIQYNLWFLLLGILAVPFVPFRPASFTKIPALLGAWGQRYLDYLKQYRKVTYTNILTSGRLNTYLADIDRQTQERFERLTEGMCEGDCERGNYVL